MEKYKAKRQSLKHLLKQKLWSHNIKACGFTNIGICLRITYISIVGTISLIIFAFKI